MTPESSKHVTAASRAAQHGSPYRIASVRRSSLVKEEELRSDVSQHGSSSHYVDVRSFSADDRPPKHDVRPAASTSKAAAAAPDYPSPSFGHTPLVPSAQFRIDDHDCRQRRSASRSPSPTTSVRDMHTPPIRGATAGSDRCSPCEHSTPMPSHTQLQQQQQTIAADDLVRNDGGSRISQVRSPLPDDTSATGNNETSRSNADAAAPK